jgi:hypothetical protein
MAPRPGFSIFGKGVEFHNGKTLTADDVIATYNYHRDESSKSAAKGLLSGDCKEIKKDGDNRVIFELRWRQRRLSVHCVRLSHYDHGHRRRRCKIALIQNSPVSVPELTSSKSYRARRPHDPDASVTRISSRKAAAHFDEVEFITLVRYHSAAKRHHEWRR